MRRKRIVSSIAALTMAASAFAGMAVTASASAWTNPYTMSNAEEITNVYLGTDNGNGTVTPEDFEEYEDLGAFDSVIATRDSGIVAPGDTEGKNQYGTGYGLSINTGANSKDTYSFKNEVTSGKLIFRGDFANVQRNEYIEILGRDSENNEVSIFKIVGANSNYGAINVYNNGIAVDQSRNSINWRNQYGLTVSSVVIDLETQTVSWSYDGIRASTNNDNNHNGTYETVATRITGIAIGNDASSRVGTSPTLDNIALYSVDYRSNSKDYTVTAVSDSVNLGIINTGIGVIGEPSVITGIPEVIEKDGTFYRLSDSNVTNHTFSYLVDETGSATVNYTASSSIIAYDEAENLENVLEATSGEVYSNGAYSAVTSRAIAALGTFRAGQYKITYYLVDRGDRGFYIRDMSNNDEDTNTIANSGTNRDSIAGEYEVEFTLTQETTIGVSGFTSDVGKYNQSSNVDYIIVERTGDLPVDPEPETDYVAANVSKSADESGLFIGDEGEKFPSAAVITGTVDATDLAENGKYTWVVNVNDNLFAKEFTATTTISGNSDVVFGLIVYNFEDVGLTDVNADDVQARLYLKGLDEITQPIE